MPTSTLTVTQADGSSETYTINRDKFEGIRTMNRKLDETIGDPENITGFTVSIGIASTNGTYTKSGLINGKPLFFLDSNNDFELRWTGTQWLWHDDNNGDVFYTSSEDTDYPWEVTTWVGGSQPTFSSFVGGTIGSTVTDTVSVDHTPTDDIRNLLVDAQNVTINRSLGGGIRTLFIDGVEVTIDRSDELIVQRFLDLFTGATAAYSLRRLGSYNGSALRIRRTSDNVEVNVAFNSAEAVGTDSPITNTTEQGGEIGSTTATTLGAFLSEPIPTFTTDFSSGVDGFISYSSDTLAGNEDGIGGEDNNLSSTQSGAGQVVYGLNGKTTIGKKYKVSFKYYVPSGSGSYTQISIRDGASAIIGSDESPTTNNWISVEATAVVTTPQIRFQFTGTSVVGEKIYIRDVVVSEIGEAKVHTWYDQSGNGNDATQNATGEQPKIASNGVLLSDGILFDGDGDALNMPTDLISSVNSASAFMVAKAVETDSSRVALALSSNSPDFRFYLPAIVSSNFNFGYGTSATAISLGAADTGEHLFSATAGSSTAEAFLDGVSKGTVSSLDGKSALTSDGIGGINSSTHWSGNIKEIIIYASDQSANRTAIDSNIIDYYDII